MREIERSGASVEEAVRSALAELGVSPEEASVEVLREPAPDEEVLLPAVVRVRTRSAARLGGSEERPDPGTAAEAAESAGDGDHMSRIAAGEQGEANQARDQEQQDLEEDAELAAEFLEGLLEAMDLDADVEIHLSEGAATVELWGADSGEAMGVLIGRHGQTLEALQELTRMAVQRRTGDRCRVVVDVEDYRKRRRSQIEAKAREVALRVQKTGRAEGLEPMSAFERKIVHDAVAEVEGLGTTSEGEEPRRRVVISRAANLTSR